jgi:hypothetical protein
VQGFEEIRVHDHSLPRRSDIVRNPGATWLSVAREIVALTCVVPCLLRLRRVN